VYSSLVTAGSAAAGTAAGAGTPGAGNPGHFPAAVLGKANAGRHDSSGLFVTAGAGSIFIRLAEWLHQLKGDITVRTGVFINGHFLLPF